MWSTPLSKLLDEFGTLIVLVYILCSPHLGDYLDGGDQCLISHLSPLFEQRFVLLIVGLVDLRQFPSEHILLSLRFIGPAIPLMCTLMQNRHDLIQKLNRFLLKHVYSSDIVLEFDYHKANISSVSWDHDFKLTVTFRNGITNYKCSKLAEAHLK